MEKTAMGCCIMLTACAVLASASEEDRAVIANAHLGLEFNSRTGGVAVLTAKASGHEFIRRPAEKPLLWRLVLRDSAGKEIVLDNTQGPSPVFKKEDTVLAVEWNGMDAGDEKGVIDVRALCELPRDADTALLRLWAKNRSKAFGLWHVQFPVIAPLSEAGAADVAIGRGNWGELYPKTGERIRGEYPSNNLPMQFVLVNEQDNGLYLAAHDPGAMYKVFEVQPGGEFTAINRAIDMGMPGNEWAAPYAFALGVYRGDWMTGCKRYRAWALQDAPWTQKGPLTKRSDVADSIKGVCAWLNASGPPEEVVPAVRQFAQAIGAPVGVHWYNWHQIPFDTHYPDYFPPKPGFPEGVAELKKAGVVVMPYINARLWDSGNEDFAQAKPAATTDEDGHVTIEEYGSGAKLAVMCPTQALWQSKVAEIIHRLVEECGVNAVYLDQIGSAPPRVCFTRDHGHPVGSGDWWVSGYRKLLTPIKQWCTSGGRQVGLTTENDAEPYLDNIDAHLIWMPRDDHEIPMTTAVYSGYTLYFASNRTFAYGDASYCLCQARDFVWGSQLGWDDVNILKPEHAGKLQFLARLARLRARAMDYLVYGELLEVLQPRNEVPDLTGTWNTRKGDSPVKLKAAHAAVWRGRDGSFAVILANADTVPHGFAFSFDGERYGAGQTTQWKVVQIGVEATTDLPAQSGASFLQTIELAPRDTVMVVLKSAA